MYLLLAIDGQPIARITAAKRLIELVGHKRWQVVLCWFKHLGGPCVVGQRLRCGKSFAEPQTSRRH
jgi:hypothetical protein